MSREDLADRLDAEADRQPGHSITCHLLREAAARVRKDQSTIDLMLTDLQIAWARRPPEVHVR